MYRFEDNPLAPVEVLNWYLDAGVDEAVGEQPLDRYALLKAAQAERAEQAQAMLKEAQSAHDSGPESAQTTAQGQAPKASLGSARIGSGPVAVRPADAIDVQKAMKDAVERAAAAKTLDQLRTALETFDGCGLKKNATHLVFGDGNPKARIVLIGEAPGADEDRQGVPFVGASGQLLDKMLASIGLDRTSVFLSNTVFWRPPGNRSPNPGEISVCLPFVERMIEIINPVVLITVGGPATHSLLAHKGSISRLRGQWFTYETPKMSHPVAATAIYHPQNLLSTPAHKRQTWLDLMAIKAKLAEHA